MAAVLYLAKLFLVVNNNCDWLKPAHNPWLGLDSRWYRN
jgi:hypothetical protein